MGFGNETLSKPSQHVELTATRTTEQTTQINTSAQAYQPIEEELRRFGQSTPGHIVQTFQAVPNCGCMAAAMAIHSIEHKEITSRLRDTQEIKRHQDNIFDLAGRIQTWGTVGFQTAIGEMFDAECLERTINAYASDKPFLAKTCSFQDADRMRIILRECGKKGIRVLLPYYAAADMVPTVPRPENGDIGADGKVRQDKMVNAHWAVLTDYTPRNDPRYDLVGMFEGNGAIMGRGINLEQLVASNMSLGDMFSWNDAFWKGQEEALGRIEQSTGLSAEEKARLEQIQADYIFATKVAVAQRSVPIMDWNDEEIKSMQNVHERVNLRGKAVLVGIKAEAAEART